MRLHSRTCESQKSVVTMYAMMDGPVSGPTGGSLARTSATAHSGNLGPKCTKGDKVTGLLEIKDTHRHLEGHMLLGIALVQGPGAVCVLDFKQTLYRPRLVLQGQLNQTKHCEVAPFFAP